MTTLKKLMCCALAVTILLASVAEASKLEKLAGLALIIGGLAGGGLGGLGGGGGGKGKFIPIPIHKSKPKVTHHTQILPAVFAGYHETYHVSNIGHYGGHGGHGGGHGHGGWW